MGELTEFIKDEPQSPAPRKGKTPQGTAKAPQGTAKVPQGTAKPQRNTSLTSGSEGTIIVQPGNKALKVYKPDQHCNPQVLSLVKQLNGQGFSVDLYDYGTMDYQGQRRDFELMQYCPLGPVSNRNDLKGNADAILKIAISTAQALNAFHQAGFIHKDVKPANILIENDKTWHCLLCDFGIADLVADAARETLQARTPIYAAPEMYDPSNCVIKGNDTYCRLTPAADYYSLGMSILSLWWGEEVLRSKYEDREVALAFSKKDNEIALPNNMPEPLRTITRGLLQANPHDRWGWKEIEAKLQGKDVQIHHSLKVDYNRQKNQVAHSPEELAVLMTQDLGLAQRYLYTDMVSDWLKPMPELQVQIREIVAEHAKDKKELGLLKVLHTLNPLFDLNLYIPQNGNDERWAMTDDRIGELLNNAYYLYFVKYGRNQAAMTRNWDDDDAKMMHSPMVAYQLAHSFEQSSDKNYLPWFLATKMKGRFADQLRWYKSCVSLSADDKKKAGPKDPLYLAQRAMMRTIAGFNATPTYRLIHSDTVFHDLDDFHDASSRDLRDALVNERGIRGWLAVMHHENPHLNLRPKYTYEKHLEQFVQDLGYCDSNYQTYLRFHQAQDQAQSISDRGKAQIRRLHFSYFLQKFLAFTIAFIPCLILLVSVFLNLIDHPIIHINTDKIKWLLGIIAGGCAVLYYLFWGDEGCFVTVIMGVILFVVLLLVVKYLGAVIVWIYALVVLAVFIYLTIATLFNFNKYTQYTRSVTNPGFEELVLEPLYFAFSNETVFDSSMNAGVDPNTVELWRLEIRNRWNLVIIYIVSTWLLVACSLLLPPSERMSKFNHHWRQYITTTVTDENNTETLETPENDEAL